MHNVKHADVGQLSSFTHLRALLVLMTAAFFGPGNYRRWARGVAYDWCAVSAELKSDLLHRRLSAAEQLRMYAKCIYLLVCTV
jgi:hypothetical protein